jgi:hypothetical protein
MLSFAQNASVMGKAWPAHIGLGLGRAIAGGRVRGID